MTIKDVPDGTHEARAALVLSDAIHAALLMFANPVQRGPRRWLIATTIRRVSSPVFRSE